MDFLQLDILREMAWHNYKDCCEEAFSFWTSTRRERHKSKKSKTWGPPPLVVALEETKIAMVNATNSVRRRHLCILAFHFYLI